MKYSSMLHDMPEMHAYKTHSSSLSDLFLCTKYMIMQIETRDFTLIFLYFLNINSDMFTIFACSGIFTAKMLSKCLTGFAKFNHKVAINCFLSH